LNSLPGISQIPILGALFSSQSFQRNESELLVMVTAYIVEPVAEGEAEMAQSAIETKQRGVQLPLQQTFQHNLQRAFGEKAVSSVPASGMTGYLLD
jgi:pilus assembly protein CpaC